MAGNYFERHGSLLGEIKAFNDRQLSEHAETPRGVGWNSPQAQSTRFEQLLKVIQPQAHSPTISLNDVGCGYGALLQHLADLGTALDYRGYDISEKMVETARSRNRDSRFATFVFKPLEQISPASYTVASGVFGMRFGHSDELWHGYVLDTLDLFDANSASGFAFNMLTSYSDEDKTKAELYYADPGKYFDLCKRRYSKNVALYHDYSLYDFSLIVRKA